MNKLLLELELHALSSVVINRRLDNLHLADVIRTIRLSGSEPLGNTERWYSAYTSYSEGILTYIKPFNKALANCKGCGTNLEQAYIDYCERLAAQFKLVHGL